MVMSIEYGMFGVNPTMHCIPIIIYRQSIFDGPFHEDYYFSQVLDTQI